MPDSPDPKKHFKKARNVTNSQSAGLAWTPLPVSEFAAELARSNPHSHYAVESLIGFGNFGAVYAAEDRRTGLRVAIKMLRQDALHDEAYRARFDREIELMQQLDPHPNVVRILDAGETLGGYRFFVMERLKGQTLAHALKNFLPRLDRIVEIMSDICAGVQHIHNEKIIHRDLKAENVFILDEDGRAVILDFGVARDATSESSTLSVAQGVPGTPGYIAPELKQGVPATEQSDIFSLGMILYHIATGRIPDGGHERPSKYVSLGDSRIDDVAFKAIEREPAARFATAAAFSAALLEATRPIVFQSPHVFVPPPPSTDPPSSPVSKIVGSEDPPSPPRDIVIDPSETRLHLHREFLTSWTPPQRRKKWTSTPISQDERWEVIHQWTATPELPQFDEVQKTLAQRRRFSRVAGLAGLAVALGMAVAAAERWLYVPVLFVFIGLILGSLAYEVARWLFERVVVPKSEVWNWNSLIGENWEHDTEGYRNLSPEYKKGQRHLDPKLLLWHPSQEYLFVSRDHLRMTGWNWDPGRSTENNPQLRRVGLQAVFSGGLMQSVFWSDRSFLIKSTSSWWSRSTLFAPSDHWIIYDYSGHRRCIVNAGSDSFQLFGNQHSNPWRPEHQGEEILTFPSNDTVSSCQVSKLPPFLNFPIGTADRSIVRTFAKVTVSLRRIQLSEKEFVGSFAWHPSGFYIAVEISGRLHLLHWDNAELVSTYVPPTGERYEAVAWSPDGSLLAVDRTLGTVLDVRTHMVRKIASHERWDFRQVGNFDSKITSCDRLRTFHSRTCGGIYASNFHANIGVVTDMAWSPYDPDVFATLGGENCPQDIRIWHRVIKNA